MSNEYLGRMDATAAAKALGFNIDEIAILMAKNKLRPLGSPKANGRKYFAAIEIERLGRDIDWLHQATLAITNHWKSKNQRRKPAPWRDGTREV